MTHKSIMLKGKPCIVVEPINEHQFNTIAELFKLVEEQGLVHAVLTQAAWSKFETLLTPKDFANDNA